jgi:uncharacterized membrane protein YedE/YeeE
MIARAIIALIAGALFGMGLALSGMIDLARVRAFLDIFGGAWDPTLGFVMAAALIPMSLAWMIQRRLERPLVEACFSLPETGAIDRKLLLGAAIFGVGWGLGGLCPGPAIADLVLRSLEAAAFVGAMLCGFVLHAFAPPR